MTLFQYKLSLGMKRLIIQSVRKLQAGEPVTLGDTTGGTNRDVMQEKLHTMFEPPQPVSLFDVYV